MGIESFDVLLPLFIGLVHGKVSFVLSKLVVGIGINYCRSFVFDDSVLLLLLLFLLLFVAYVAVAVIFALVFVQITVSCAENSGIIMK